MMKRLTFWLWLAIAFLTPVAFSSAADEKGADARRQEVIRRIDELAARRWREEGVSSAGPCSDGEFVRRAFLDLTGRVPRVAEVHAFLAAEATARREMLVEELLGLRAGEFGPARPQHATNLAETWQRMLLPDGFDLRRYGGGTQFSAWLRRRFADNAPYDEMVRELLVAEGQFSEPGPVLFYSALEVKPEELASVTSRALLGVQISCAQCHDHPFDHWSQQDFWGLAAFFARLQRPAAGAQFAAVVREVSDGEVMLPGSDEPVPPRFLDGEIAAREPGITRRQQLAEWFTSPRNPFFARAAVNRLWAHLFGRGIVDPVDDLGDHNPPSHPELLDELAAYFVETDFDVRNLLLTLALTETYQLSSRPPAGDPPPELFACMAIKPLRAEQLYDCIGTVTCRREGTPAGGQRFGLGAFDQNRLAFVNQFAAPAGSATEYQGGIPQALTLMNGALIQTAVGSETSDLLISLEAPFFTDEQRVETLFLAVLSRPPSQRELDEIAGYVRRQSTEEERRDALADVLWALLNTAEFSMNH